MEALVPAFIAALLCLATDRSAWLSAILADRYGRPLLVTLMAVLAQAGSSALAVLGAQLIAPTLTPNARSLLLALALLMGGFDGLFPLRKLDRLDAWRIGSVFTPLLGIFILALGDRTSFFTLAFAVRTPLPWMAAAGTVTASLVVHAAATASGELVWRGLPLGWLRLLVGLFCLIAGTLIGLSALRLI